MLCISRSSEVQVRGGEGRHNSFSHCQGLQDRWTGPTQARGFISMPCSAHCLQLAHGQDTDIQAGSRAENNPSSAADLPSCCVQSSHFCCAAPSAVPRCHSLPAACTSRLSALVEMLLLQHKLASIWLGF